MYKLLRGIEMSKVKEVTNEQLFEMMELMYSELSKGLKKNAEGIKKNGEAIERNAVAIKENAAAIKENAAAIKENTAAIKENTAAIKENTVAIKGNSAEIASNRHVILKLELEHGKKIGLLLDGYQFHSEKLDYISHKLSANSSKWDRYELEILALKKKIAL